MVYKFRKYILFFAAFSLIVLVIFFVEKYFTDKSFRSRVPMVPEFSGSIQAQKEQIIDASAETQKNPSARNIGELGLVYHSNSFYDLASECYLLASYRKKNQWKWDYYNGYLKREMGDSKSALKFFRAASDKNRKACHAFYYMADLYYNLGETDSAENYYKKVALMDEKNPVTYEKERGFFFRLSFHAEYHLSRILIDHNRLDEAESVLQGIISKEPYFGPAYRLMGNLYALKGDTMKSYKYTVMVNDHLPYFPPVDTLIDRLSLISRSDQLLLKQIDAAIGSRNYEWAIKLIKHSLFYFSEDKYLIAKAVKIFFLLNYDKEAAGYLDRHFKYIQDDFNQLQEIAEILLEKGYLAQALPYFRQLSELVKGDPEKHSDLALWAWRYNMKKEALEMMEELVKENPVNPKILYDISFMLLSDHNISEAQKYINILSGLPGKNSLYMNIIAGLKAEDEKRINDAIACYEEAFRQGKQDIQFIYYLGNLYFRLEIWEKALSFHKNALSLYPNDPNILGKIGYLLVSGPDQELRNYSDGYEFSVRAFRHYATIPIMRISAGESASLAAMRLGKLKEATSFVNLTVETAKRVGMPEDAIKRLKNLQNQISVLQKKNN